MISGILAAIVLCLTPICQDDPGHHPLYYEWADYDMACEHPANSWCLDDLHDRRRIALEAIDLRYREQVCWCWSEYWAGHITISELADCTYDAGKTAETDWEKFLETWNDAVAACCGGVKRGGSSIIATLYGVMAPQWSQVEYWHRSTDPLPCPGVDVLFELYCTHNEQGELVACGEAVCDGCWPKVLGIYIDTAQAVHNEQGDPLVVSFLLPDFTELGGEYAGSADVNLDGFRDSQDFFDFMSRWGGGEGYDFNVDGFSDSQDYFDFISVLW